MSTDHDVTRIVRSWLEEGTTVVPDRVLDAVLDQVPATRQRRLWWPARRFLTMNNTMRVALAAAAALALAFIGFRYLLPGNQTGGPRVSATAAPTPMPRLNDQNSLPAGRYQADPSLPAQVSVEVPDGWRASGNWVVIGPNGNQEPDGTAIRFYTATNLYVHPQTLSDGVLSPPVGPSVDDLVNAMLNHPDWHATTGDRNGAIMIDGFPGRLVHVTLPPGTSHTSLFYLFGNAAYDPQEWGWAEGQAFDIYVVDVGGKRLVIDAFHYPGTSQKDLAAQSAVLDSIKLTPIP